MENVDFALCESGTDGDSIANKGVLTDHSLTMRMGWTYFIGTELGEPFKIGKTDKPDYRLCTLQAGNPRRLSFLVAFQSADPRAAEGWFHDYFKDARLIGEWFDWSDDAAEVIARLRRGCAYTLRPRQATGHVRVGDAHFRFGSKWR